MFYTVDLLWIRPKAKVPVQKDQTLIEHFHNDVVFTEGEKFYAKRPPKTSNRSLKILDIMQGLIRLWQ